MKRLVFGLKFVYKNFMFVVTSWTDFSWSVVASVVATGIAAIIAFVFRDKLKSTYQTFMTAYRLYFVLSTIRMRRFTRSRADYDLFQPEAKSIDNYVKHARRTLTIVSINLVTGVKFHGMCQSLKNLLERDQPVEIHISLLDFRESCLMKTIAPALDLDAEGLTRSIESGFESLFAFKSELSPKGQGYLHIHAHRCIPFASAIIIDEKESSGRIQIETKAYRAAFDESWGFELQNGGSHKMFENFVHAYKRLIQDGVELSQFVGRCA